MKKTIMLKKNYQFKAVLTRGICFKEKEIEIFILKNNKKRNYLGIAIGTKNGKAYQRNKAKRLIRESYTRLENNLIDGNSIVVLMNKYYPIENLTFNGILEEMNNIFINANITQK